MTKSHISPALCADFTNPEQTIAELFSSHLSAKNSHSPYYDAIDSIRSFPDVPPNVFAQEYPTPEKRQKSLLEQAENPDLSMEERLKLYIDYAQSVEDARLDELFSANPLPFYLENPFVYFNSVIKEGTAVSKAVEDLPSFTEPEIMLKNGVLYFRTTLPDGTPQLTKVNWYNKFYDDYISVKQLPESLSRREKLAIIATRTMLGKPTVRIINYPVNIQQTPLSIPLSGFSYHESSDSVVPFNTQLAALARYHNGEIFLPYFAFAEAATFPQLEEQRFVKKIKNLGGIAVADAGSEPTASELVDLLAQLTPENVILGGGANAQIFGDFVRRYEHADPTYLLRILDQFKLQKQYFQSPPRSSPTNSGLKLSRGV